MEEETGRGEAMNEELQIATLQGQVSMLEEEAKKTQAQLDYFARSQEFWRIKYLNEHPEHNNWHVVDTVENKIQEGIPLEDIYL